MSAPAKPGLGSSASDTVDRVETVDARMIALTRCMLAFSALAIIWIDPSEPKRLVELTYASLAVYCIYSAVLAVISYRSDWPAPKRALHWVDILFYAYLVGLTEGTSSIFFYFFLFAILVASFAWGFRESLAVTLASFALFTTVGLTFAPTGDEFELNRTLIRAVYLFVFGYMIAYWGGYEALLKRRLKLLREINSLWHPRFGVAHAVGTNLDRLLAFFGGTSCVLVLRRPTAPPGCLMYTASLQKPEQSTIPSQITAGAAEALLRLPETVAAYYHDPAVSWLQRFRGHAAYDVRTLKRAGDFPAECEALANLLDAQAFITAPYAQSDGTTGRIFVVAGDIGFTRADVEFLTQAMSAFATVVDNMHLTEELISQASKQERLAISRDLHDSTIQPYIGLKLALDALQRDAGAGGPVAPRIAELVEMAGMTIRDLRTYAASLKERAPMPGEFLVAAVRKQSERLGQFYGIDVEVKSDISAHLDGRISAEAFQIISEGLSNILRHTSAKAAYVSILCENSNLLLKIANEARGGSSGDFTPRSIRERAQALGGAAFVERGADGYTVVHVTIPM